MPGFVRYREEGGATMYDSYYFPSSNKKRHSRGASAYSLTDTESEGAIAMGLYDPPSAGLPGSKYEMLPNTEEDYQDDDRESRDYRDNDRHSVLEPPPGLGASTEPSTETVEAVRRRRDSSESQSLR
jgi:hypothetical protein